jgi:DNA (cytosine-5)-methyltransferase 1
MTEVYDKRKFIEADIDLLVGGTPCPSFSTAGKRAGLTDPRGQLAMEFLRIAAVKKPRWLVWENVSGILSSNGGKDFAAFLWDIRALGYGFGYRVLDSKFFGLPQRRRRVFLVAYLGDWRPPILALFDPDDFWKALESRGCNKVRKLSEFLSNHSESDLPLGVDTFNDAVTGDVAATLGAHAYNRTGIGPKVLDKHGIRTPTPTECERLMGFSDGYTSVDYPCSTRRQLDKLRIGALGNSMAVPVMRWIGEGIETFEKGLPSWQPLPGGPISSGCQSGGKGKN